MGVARRYAAGLLQMEYAYRAPEARRATTRPRQLNRISLPRLERAFRVFVCFSSFGGLRNLVCILIPRLRDNAAIPALGRGMNQMIQNAHRRQLCAYGLSKTMLRRNVKTSIRFSTGYVKGWGVRAPIGGGPHSPSLACVPKNAGLL